MRFSLIHQSSSSTSASTTSFGTRFLQLFRPTPARRSLKPLFTVSKEKPTDEWFLEKKQGALATLAKLGLSRAAAITERKRRSYNLDGTEIGPLFTELLDEVKEEEVSEEQLEEENTQEVEAVKEESADGVVKYDEGEEADKALLERILRAIGQARGVQADNATEGVTETAQGQRPVEVMQRRAYTGTSIPRMLSHSLTSGFNIDLLTPVESYFIKECRAMIVKVAKKRGVSFQYLLKRVADQADMADVWKLLGSDTPKGMTIPIPRFPSVPTTGRIEGPIPKCAGPSLRRLQQGLGPEIVEISDIPQLRKSIPRSPLRYVQTARYSPMARSEYIQVKETRIRQTSPPATKASELVISNLTIKYLRSLSGDDDDDEETISTPPGKYSALVYAVLLHQEIDDEDFST